MWKKIKDLLVITLYTIGFLIIVAVATWLCVTDYRAKMATIKHVEQEQTK